MLWASDSIGRIVSFSEDWLIVARSRRKPRADPHGREACLDLVHPDDLVTVRRALTSRLPSIAGHFRIRQDGGASTRISFTGWPALAPTDGSFCGYIGTAEVVPAEATAPSDDAPGAVTALPTLSNDYLQKLTDLFIEARSIAHRANDKRLMVITDFALSVVGDRAAHEGEP